MYNLTSLRTTGKKAMATVISAAIALLVMPTQAHADAVLSGTLYRGEAGWITLNDMESGKLFRVLGTCDYDCSDMDFRLYDGNRNLVAWDTLYDDTPIVQATPRWQGDFYLKVSLPSCSTSFCNYDVYIDD